MSYLRKTEVRHVHDVGMAQATRRPCLAPEPLHKLIVLHKLWRDYFESHGPLGPQMVRRIDCAHPAFAELLFDAVLAVKNLANKI